MKKKKSLIESGISRKNGIAFRTKHGKWALTTVEDGIIKKELTDSMISDQSIIGEKNQAILGLTYVIGIIVTICLSGGWLDVLRYAIMLNVLAIVIAVAFIYQNKGDMLKYHSAEHMAINALNHLGRMPELEELKSYSRFSKDCGSNIVLCIVIFFTVMLICTFVFNISQSIIVLWLTVNALAVFRHLGWLNFCQYVSTEKPTEKELALAIEGLKFWQECNN